MNTFDHDIRCLSDIIAFLIEHKDARRLCQYSDIPALLRMLIRRQVPLQSLNAAQQQVCGKNKKNERDDSKQNEVFHALWKLPLESDPRRSGIGDILIEPEICHDGKPGDLTISWAHDVEIVPEMLEEPLYYLDYFKIFWINRDSINIWMRNGRYESRSALLLNLLIKLCHRMYFAIISNSTAIDTDRKKVHAILLLLQHQALQRLLS